MHFREERKTLSLKKEREEKKKEKKREKDRSEGINTVLFEAVIPC